MDIEEDIKKVSERFNNGTETIEDILKYCRNFKFTFENGIKLQLVEKKYLDRLIKEYKNLLAEREEDKKKIEELEKKNRIYALEGSKIALELHIKDNYIPKQKVKEVIKKIKEILDIAEEQIESKIIIADSDSLNFGRKQAHGKDIELIERLLEDK